MFGFHSLRHAADAVPVSVVIAVAAPMPLWRVYLEQVHDYASIVASVFGVLLALLKGWAVWKESREARGAAAQGLASAAASAAKAGSRAPGFLMAALAAIGVLAAVSMLTSKRAEAAPVVPAATQAKPRKRASDHAGDDGEADAGAVGDAPSWFAAMYADIGLSERAGNRSNPKVSAFFAHVDGFNASTDARKVPWCAAGTNAYLERNGVTGTRSAMARSFLRWGKALDEPRRGCIVVMWRGEHDDGSSGHVGLFDREDARYVYVLGCNQGDAIGVARFPKSRVLGYRWPRNIATTKTVIGAAVAAAGSGTTVAVQVAADVKPLIEPAAGPSLPPGLPHIEGAAQAIEAARGPLQQVAHALHGTSAARYLLITLAVLSMCGAFLAIYGRQDVRTKTGV